MLLELLNSIWSNKQPFPFRSVILNKIINLSVSLQEQKLTTFFSHTSKAKFFTKKIRACIILGWVTACNATKFHFHAMLERKLMSSTDRQYCLRKYIFEIDLEINGHWKIKNMDAIDRDSIGAPTDQGLKCKKTNYKFISFPCLPNICICDAGTKIRYIFFPVVKK